MKRPTRKRKCLPCQACFVSDYRNVGRQRSCSKPSCKQASTAQSQRRWLQKPENRAHFCGPDNVKRVQLWRQDHPGSWRRKAPAASEAPNAFQETFTPQAMTTQGVTENVDTPQQDALQEAVFIQPAVLVGLIAQ